MEEKKIVEEKDGSISKRFRTFFEEAREWKLTPKSFFLSFVWLSLLLFVIDIVSKWAIQLNFEPGYMGGETFVIPGFFSIFLTYNQGSAFGMGSGTMFMRVIFILISWIATLVIPFFYYHQLRKNDLWINAVYALCWAGAAGNLIDRTFYWEETVGFSGVIDFFCFYIFGADQQPFAIFNVADACLTVGIAMLIVILLVRAIKQARKEA